MRLTEAGLFGDIRIRKFSPRKRYLKKDSHLKIWVMDIPGKRESKGKGPEFKMQLGVFKEKKECWNNANLMSKDKNTRLDWRSVAEHLLISDVISAIYCYGTNLSQNLVL